MRLVDIDFKYINGQASDIKGNLNTIGHLMMLGVGDDVVPFVSGYFEVDGSFVKDGVANYPELARVIKADVGGIDTIADIRDKVHIELGARPAFLKSQGRDALVVGSSYYIQTHGAFDELTFIMRLFIYHGVHV